jgi:DNA polymerase type B, organellar and viral
MYQMKAEATKDSPNYLIAKLLMNSLYGRFGMAPIKNTHLIVDAQYHDAIVEEKGVENVYEVFNLNNKIMMTVNEPFISDININVAVALAVTANARVDMSIFKNNPALMGYLYYSDTDSVFCTKELPEYMVNETKLGKLKLEHRFSDFVALGPKVYGGIAIEGKEIVKAKGIKNKIPFTLLKTMLSEDLIVKMSQHKWYKDIVDSVIRIYEEPYSLKPTNNKRELVYKNNYLVTTKNKIIND